MKSLPWRLVRRLGLLVFAFMVLLGTGAPARAQDDFIEQIHSYAFDATIEPDGDLLVEETIVYDFGTTARHGIFRDIPTTLRYDDTHDRVYRLNDVVVWSETAPDTVVEEDGPGGTTRLRIGDADRTITGEHTYAISYRLEGALNAFDDHIELYWNAIGNEWPLRIGDVTAIVTAPAAIERAACYSGPYGSQLPCETSAIDGSTARFTEDVLHAYEGMSFVVSLPTGAVAAGDPILVERWTPQQAFKTDAPQLSSLFALLGLVLAGVGVLVWRTGRDRRSVGNAVDAAFGEGEDHERVPLFGGYDGPVQVEPPDGLRPGQVGTLIDERANPLDVTATVIDLAVRGYLRIEEIEKDGIAGWFGKPDWRLVKLKGDDGLQRYEEILHNGLFAGGDVVLLSDLKDTFASKLKKVQDALYVDAMDRRWFARSPQATRAKWIVIGIVVVALGVALTVAAAAFTSFGLVPLPIVLAGLLLMALSGRMPHRTPAGTGTLIRTLGFKRFIDESERDRARFAEQQHLFTEYLPYAVVFGATEKWARAFAGLDGELPDQSSWYVSRHPFTFMAFSSSMDGFATTAAGTIASTPSSSGTSGFGGGGFSGGGGGGGGGGSW